MFVVWGPGCVSHSICRNNDVGTTTSGYHSDQWWEPNSPGHFSHSRHSWGVLKLKSPCGCCHAKSTPTFHVLSVWQWGAYQRFCCLRVCDERFCDPALRGVAQNQTSEVSIWLALPLVLPPARSRSFRLVIQSYLEHFRRLFLNRVPKLCQCQEKH